MRKKSTRQNLPQSEHPAPSENPKNPVQRQKEKKGPQLVRDPQFAAFALQARSRCSAALLVVASWFLH